MGTEQSKAGRLRLATTEAEMAASPDRSNAMDHVVVVLFENRSLDNVLGRLYGQEDGKTFEGVIGKDLSLSLIHI